MTNIPDGPLGLVTGFKGLSMCRAERVSTAATDFIRIYTFLESPILTAR
jgi:hypothetical protein